VTAGRGDGSEPGELLVASGADEGLRIPVADNMVLGRDAGADVVLEDPGGRLSRRHARIRLVDGAPVVEDLGSTNGTFVNGDRIEAARPLAGGDRIEVGDTTLEFVAAPATPPSPDGRGNGAPTFAPPGADGLLRIVSGTGAGSTAPVRGSATIGREPECDLQVLDGEVSRRHAKVTIRDGAAVIDDLHSANGTYVDGERILEQRTLRPGDQIEIGEATIVLTSPVFEGTAVRPLPAQPARMSEIVAQAPKLLTAESGTRKWWTLGVVLVSAFMLLLDVTIVGVALPSISSDLHPSFTSLQWIVDAYALMLTVLLLTAGSLADIFGRRRILTIGLIVFTVSSVICAQSESASLLALARGAQGIGGALMYGCLLALIVQEFPAKERYMAFGLYGGINALAVALGPIVGGVLVETLGWRSIFYLNVPIAIGTMIILRRKVVNLPGPEARIDWPGLVTFSGAVFLGVFATIRASSEGWTSGLILGCYGAAIVLAGLFVLVERRSASPMFDTTLFKNPTFVGSSVSGFAICFSVIALIFFFTIWFQSILGYSAIGTGLRMVPFAAIGLAFGPLAGKLTETVDPRWVLTASLTLATIGALSMIGVDASSSWTTVLPGLILTGTALGLIGPTLASTATGVVPPWRSGMAGGMNTTMRQLGTAAGIAVLGTLLAHEVHSTVNRQLEGSFLASASTKLGGAIAAGGTRAVVAKLPAAARPGLQQVARESYSSGLSTIFLTAAIVAAIGAVTAFALVRKRHLRIGPPGGNGPPGGGPPGGPPGRGDVASGGPPPGVVSAPPARAPG
jgi:EmrB/QacA subfamily drug resistance transporter